MVKDRISNVLGVGDKVLVELPTSSIIGFVGKVQEPGLVAVRRGTAANMTPGALFVSCVIALPIDGENGQVAQVVKVYDAERKPGQEPPQGAQGGSGSSAPN